MRYDAVVVGAGPNGLAAAATLAAAGRSVLLLEARDTVGGGCRTGALTLPGFLHDVCAAVHPFGAGSPYLRSLPLDRHGLAWAHPEVVLAHPLDGGRAALLHRSLADTATGLGADRARYARLVGPAAEAWDHLAPAILGPLLRVPRHPVTLARFGLPSLLPSEWLGRLALRTPEGRALLAGCSAHSFLPLSAPLTASFGLALLAAGHAAGWPVALGGSQRLADALAGVVRSRGGEIVTGRPVRSLHELPPARAVLLDLTPRQVVEIAAGSLPSRYLSRLARYRYGPGVWKVDYALDGPVPWADPECRRAGTLHLGGTAAEIAAAEADVARGRHPERPFVLVAQPGVVDPSRAPGGCHTLWAYCHVPHGSTVDMTAAVERQIERFAPGFRDGVLARHCAGPAWFATYNENDVGGDIAGGSHAGLQLLLRPLPGLHPYRTPDPRLLLCSASTPPGGGVHGMCGHHAARAALAGPLR